MRLTLQKVKKVEVPGDEDGGFINIKALSLEEIADAESRSSNVVMDAGDGNVTLTVDSFKRANIVAKECLVGWGNFFDEKGEEIKFNKSNITKVAKYSIQVEGKSIRFLEWVEFCHTQHKEEIEAEMGEASKN